MQLPSFFTIQILRNVGDKTVCFMTRSIFAITSMNLNMSTQSFHIDGTPIEFNLSMSCSETVIIDRQAREAFNMNPNLGIVGDNNQIS